jgi:DNA-binding NarL/FixJ family response regulator
MTVRVHLADDHTMFREGLEAIFATRGDDIEMVGRSSTGERPPLPSSNATGQTWSLQ